MLELFFFMVLAVIAGGIALLVILGFIVFLIRGLIWFFRAVADMFA